MAGNVCKTCQKPGFKGADGKMQHERRANAADYGGRRKDPNAPDPKKKPNDEQPPDRSHFLNRRIFGNKDGGRA